MFKDIIASRVVDFYTENGPVAEQIMHTEAVATYARLIAVKMGLSSRAVDLHESAAWLHDIGCPDAVRKYGNSSPVHQMAEGERLVNEWFSTDTDYPNWNVVLESLSTEEKEWLARAVGTHHQRPYALSLHFEPLFEADLIVNIKEGYYGRAQAQMYYEKMTITDAGRELFRKLVWEGRDCK